MCTHDTLLERIRCLCKSDPTKSISGLAEALGASKTAPRQWKSEKVKREVEKIEAARLLLESIYGYLEIESEKPDRLRG
jgi:hypothetical protein